MTSLRERRLLPERAIESLSEYVAAAGGHVCSVHLCAAQHRDIPDFDLEVKTSSGGRL